MTTIFDLLDEAARPVLDAVPARPSCSDIYAPDATDADVERLRYPMSRSPDPGDLVAEIEEHNAYMAGLRGTPFVENGDLSDEAMRAFGVMLRGPVRVMISGVYAGAAEPLDVRCYADERVGVAWKFGRETIAVRGGRFPEILDLATAFLPAERPGYEETILLPADADGVIPDSHRREVTQLRRFLRRRRRGTAVVDLLAFHNIFAEYPDLALVVIDNALGRHVLGCWGKGMVLRPIGEGWLSWWMRECVARVTTSGVGGANEPNV